MRVVAFVSAHEQGMNLTTWRRGRGETMPGHASSGVPLLRRIACGGERQGQIAAVEPQDQPVVDQAAKRSDNLLLRTAIAERLEDLRPGLRLIAVQEDLALQPGKRVVLRACDGAIVGDPDDAVAVREIEFLVRVAVDPVVDRLSDAGDIGLDVAAVGIVVREVVGEVAGDLVVLPEHMLVGGRGAGRG